MATTVALAGMVGAMVMATAMVTDIAANRAGKAGGLTLVFA